MPQTSWRREYETHRISEFTSVDENSDITDSFVTATHVMSVNSTALFEAMLLGIPALKLETPFIQTELQYPHTKIFTEHAMKSQIPGLDHEIGT
jgi:hypothetical protein